MEERGKDQVRDKQAGQPGDGEGISYQLEPVSGGFPGKVYYAIPNILRALRNARHGPARQIRPIWDSF